MATSTISPFSYRALEQNQIENNPRLLAHAGEDSGFMSTAAKTGTVFAAIIASIGGFMILGPLAGIVITLISAIGTMWYLNSGDDPHAHTQYPNGANLNISPPWYQQIFQTFVPPPAQTPHGHQHHHLPTQQHIPVGGGHIPPAPQTPWYQRFLSFIPPRTLMMNGTSDNHVPVGRGHQGQGHVPVGRGHNLPPTQTVPPQQGRGHGATQPPPPSGASGHVGVGRGHFFNFF